MMHIPFVDLTYQTAAVYKAFNKRLNRIVSGNNFILGRDVCEFEEAFAAYYSNIVN